MNQLHRSACLAIVVMLCGVHVAAGDWWERPAATWYYKDDWKGLALLGGRGYQKTFRFDEPVESGWIVLRGGRGYRLAVGGQAVGENVDGALIDDYDLTEFVKGQKDVILLIEGSRVCAEGELVTRSGQRIAFATGSDWEKVGGGKPRTEKMRVGPSTGAFHRAHNGRLLRYNDEERGKTAIAETLARLQRLEDQSLFLLRRLRPAEEILSFDQNTPWRRAEQHMEPLVRKASEILTKQAIPAQKAGQFRQVQTHAAEAGKLVTTAEHAVSTTISMYRARREMLHLENCADFAVDQEDFQTGLNDIRRLLSEAQAEHAQGDFAAAAKIAARVSHGAAMLRERLDAAEQVVTTSSLDEFPESPFGWLNARSLMGNSPERWPVTVAPCESCYLDLAGQWQFRTDPNNEGLKQGWDRGETSGSDWSEVFVPGPWEREGFTEDNSITPQDCPYELPDRRTGDKPYNGFTWYRKQVLVPARWKGRRVVLTAEGIKNWARVFVNGTALSEGQVDPPTHHEIPGRLLRFGKKNLIVVQIYNHDNFGGILTGPVALHIDRNPAAHRQTPGPLSFVHELTYETPSGPVRPTLLAGALSPGVVIATQQPVLQVWGWEAKGFPLPSTVRIASAEGVQVAELDKPKRLAAGEDLAENWVLLRSQDRDVLIMLPRRPREIVWEKNGLECACFELRYEEGPVQAALVVLPAGTDVEDCRFWARALRRVPIAASDVVACEDPANPLQRCHHLRYRYLDLDGFGALEPLTVAPLPMLASFAVEHRNPRVHVTGTRTTRYRSRYAPYRVAQRTDRLTYSAEGVDRSKVMKGIGELFHSKPPEVFRRMADWGADHVRYAWAFHADWDMPLVQHVGGPLIEDNEAVWQRLDRVVDDCNAAGMQMMLTWFFNEDSPQADAGGAVRNSTRYWRLRPETKKNAFELWRRIAQRYADKPQWAISYDFFNEPAYINRDHWNEIIQELTAVIRSVDKKHMIVWESADGWAQPSWCLWMRPSGDPNTLYSFHRYGKHWGYAYDEYYPGYKCSQEQKHFEPWLEAILFGIQHNVPIHCGEFGISIIQPNDCAERWLNDYLAFFERFGIGWNWWNYSGRNIYRTGLVAGKRESPNVAVLKKWFHQSGRGIEHK